MKINSLESTSWLLGLRPLLEFEGRPRLSSGVSFASMREDEALSVLNEGYIGLNAVFLVGDKIAPIDLSWLPDNIESLYSTAVIELSANGFSLGFKTSSV